ncbi:MAG: M20/M25/M40 family metallo-hydrolase [Dysgonomonas sp.]
MNRTVFILLIFILGTVTACSQTLVDTEPIQKGLNAITRENAIKYIEILAHDSLEGREAGKSGGLRAAEFLKKTFEEVGIKPWRGKYFQPFSGSRHGGTSSENPNMQNVLGYIKGKKTDEIVVIGAHYDHIGIRPNNTNDSIYNGADDNASGTSAVLQVAKAFVESGEKPERTIIFALWDGEEKGLLGSFYFVEDHWKYLPIPLVEPIPVKAYINLDMIGRNKAGTDGTHVVAFRSKSKPVFEEWIKNDLETYKLNLSPEFRDPNSMPGGSDHMPFDMKGVPYIFYYTDMHPDYHRESDHADKINFDKVTDISKIAFLNLWNMANIEDF